MKIVAHPCFRARTSGWIGRDDETYWENTWKCKRYYKIIWITESKNWNKFQLYNPICWFRAHSFCRLQRLRRQHLGHTQVPPDRNALWSREQGFQPQSIAWRNCDCHWKLGLLTKSLGLKWKLIFHINFFCERICLIGSGKTKQLHTNWMNTSC